MRLRLVTIVVVAIMFVASGIPGLPWSAAPVVAAGTTVVVTTTLDELDGDTASFDALTATPGGAGISLREAITAANAMPGDERLTIGFVLPDADPGHEPSAALWRFLPGPAALPPLTRGAVTIDGLTQPGAALASHPVIVLDGSNVYEDVGLNNGLTLVSAGNVVRGVALVWFWDTGIVIAGEAATDNLVIGCTIGVLSTGAGRLPNYYGIDIRDGASSNRVGGPALDERNIISGNDYAGVRIEGATTIGNMVEGNWIGLDSDGATALVNTYYGVIISGGAAENMVGAADGGNIIAGNGVGVWIAASHRNRVAGNTIGLAMDQATPQGNRDGGVFLVDGASENTIGGAAAGERNIISANGAADSINGQGIYIGQYYGTGTPPARLNHIEGNFIGVDASGIAPRGNYREGVWIGLGAVENRIGGVAPALGNVIAYNGLSGVVVSGNANQVAGNLIGVGADGITPLGNQRHGVRIAGDGNTLGPGNTLAHNQLSGALLSGHAGVVTQNVIQRNRRSGICVTGQQPAIAANAISANGGADAANDECAIAGGVVLIGSSQGLIANNAIVQNVVAGVLIQGGDQNQMLANQISDNAAGGIVLAANANDGISAPQILSAEGSEVRGVACAECRVEVFADTGNQGGVFLGAIDAAPDDGVFVFQVAGGLPADRNITATNTDVNGNTSAFGLAVSVLESPPVYRLFLPQVTR